MRLFSPRSRSSSSWLTRSWVRTSARWLTLSTAISPPPRADQNSPVRKLRLKEATAPLRGFPPFLKSGHPTFQLRTLAGKLGQDPTMGDYYGLDTKDQSGVKSVYVEPQTDSRRVQNPRPMHGRTGSA